VFDFAVQIPSVELRGYLPTFLEGQQEHTVIARCCTFLEHYGITLGISNEYIAQVA
jgi:hypothetical protein